MNTLVTDLLIRILGKYIDFIELSPESIKIELWSGEFTVCNVKIKEEAAALLDLPFSLSSGVIGRLKVHIPWSNISSEPTIIRLSDIFILIRPNNEEKVSFKVFYKILFRSNEISMIVGLE